MEISHNKLYMFNSNAVLSPEEAVSDMRRRFP